MTPIFVEGSSKKVDSVEMQTCSMFRKFLAVGMHMVIKLLRWVSGKCVYFVRSKITSMSMKLG